MAIASPKRILAINPGMEHVGLAVFEGEKLLWYAVKKFRESKTVSEVRLQIQQYLAVLVQMYQPKVLVVEEPFYAQSLLSQHLVKITRNIKTWGKLKGLPVRGYTPPRSRRSFAEIKEQVARGSDDR